MKLGEAIPNYQAYRNELQDKKTSIYKQYKKTKEKAERTNDEEWIQKAAELELSYKEATDDFDKYENVLNSLREQWCAAANTENDKALADPETGLGATLGKIMTTIARMCAGDKVPYSDEKKVMEYDDKMYARAKQGLLHDLSKYSFSEFIPGVKYYQDGNRSPNNAQREAEGCSTAWLHHKGRNKHHYEYWIDYPAKGGDGSLIGMEMPVNYVIEMFCDRVAASKIYNKDKYTDADSLNYFKRGMDHYIINPKTKELLYSLLVMLSEKGEDYTFAYIRRNILHNG